MSRSAGGWTEALLAAAFVLLALAGAAALFARELGPNRVAGSAVAETAPAEMPR